MSDPFRPHSEQEIEDIIDNSDFLRELEAFGRDEDSTNDVESIRAAAEQDARETTRRRVTSVVESKSGKILKKRTGKTMDGIKGHVRRARQKERMRTVSHFLCDGCDETILNPEDGFIVQGNVYVADPSCRGGLIGNAFPDPDGEGKIIAADVKETVMCKMCMLRALGMDKSKSYSLTSAKRGV